MDIQVGVQTGYDLLWWYATCAVLLGFVVQCLAGQLGICTGKDLAQQCGRRCGGRGALYANAKHMGVRAYYTHPCMHALNNKAEMHMHTCARMHGPPAYAQ